MACKGHSLQIYKLGDVDNFYYNDSQFTGVILRNKVVQECTFCTGMSVLSNKDIEGWSSQNSLRITHLHYTVPEPRSTLLIGNISFNVCFPF